MYFWHFHGQQSRGQGSCEMSSSSRISIQSYKIEKIYLYVREKLENHRTNSEIFFTVG